MPTGSEIAVQRHPAAAWRSAPLPVRKLLACLGLAWASAFILIGTLYHLQLYGDGAVFSFAVVIGESWAVHWHNIVGRSTVLLCCLLPAESAARWTQNAQAGVAIYGALFFSAPAVGLALTRLCDRSDGRAFFTTACVSTACLCPLVFGFPTEMWIAHAIFWPALAIAHQEQRGRLSFVRLLLATVALVFTHEGALVLSAVLVATTSMRRSPYPFFRSSAAVAIALVLLALAHAMAAPDSYFSPVLAHARRHFFDLRTFTSGEFALLASTLTAYAALLPLRRHGPAFTAAATAIVFAGLVVYWFWFSPPVHAENRYCLRTALVILMPVMAVIATLLGLKADEQRPLPAQLTRHLRRMLDQPMAAQSAIGAVVLLTLVHAVETKRFVSAWTTYTAEIRMLASGAASDPALGDARFVSSERIDEPLKALAWSSTTPFLSVLAATDFSPRRLVVDPAAGYFWLPCELSHSIEAKRPQVLPAEALGLISAYSCLHR